MHLFFFLPFFPEPISTVISFEQCFNQMFKSQYLKGLLHFDHMALCSFTFNLLLTRIERERVLCNNFSFEKIRKNKNNANLVIHWRYFYFQFKIEVTVGANNNNQLDSFNFSLSLLLLLFLFLFFCFSKIINQPSTFLRKK